MADDNQGDRSRFYSDRGLARDAKVEGLNYHGINPALLIEKIIRERILDSLYYKDACFALTSSTILDRIVALTYIGGQYGAQKPTEFLCLVFKLLQLQPEKEIVVEMLKSDDGGEEWKYLRAVAAFYIRLTFPAREVYELLEPFYADYRKLRVRHMGGWSLTTMDQFVDELLREERVCDIALPRIPTRMMLEEAGELEARDSALGSEVEESDAEEV
ncbi:hypothetical protein YB2330_004989 [Saitoella coloradoensis]